MERDWRPLLVYSILSLTCSVTLAQRLESFCASSGPEDTVHDFVFQDLAGDDFSLRNLANGKALLVVNVATFWGYTEQYPQLNALKDFWNDSGQLLEIMAVPCNQFGLQEPGKNEELLNGLRYVRPGNGYVPNFVLTAKTEVNGEGAHPMFNFLKVSNKTKYSLIVSCL